MSKRPINSKNSVTKKLRVDESLDFWDDDFDGEAVDDCFERATQIVEDRHTSWKDDVSLVSSYSIFKEPKHIFTSTQHTQPGVSNENTGIKIKELQEKYAEKEGEVSILRSNLERLRSTCEIDQRKKQMEWKEKLSAFEKENKTIKSELEFKNLEIVNLKQQIAEFSKYVTVEQSFTQKSQITHNKLPPVASPEKHVKPVSVGSRIYISVEKSYPLKSLHFSFASKGFHSKRSNSNLECFLQDQRKSEETDSLVFTEKFDASYIYQELLSVINLSSEDLDSDKNISQLNKVLFFSIQLLTYFYDYLKLLEVETRLQQGGEFDVHLLQSNSSKIIEASLLCGEIVILLGEIIPFSTHLKYQLLSDRISHLDEIPHYQKNFQSGLKKWAQKPNYMILLSDIISVIGHAKISGYCTQFLFVVMKLLCRMYSAENMNYIRRSMVEEILIQIFSLNIDSELGCQLNIFLNILTHDANFIYFLCPIHTNVKDCSIKVSCRLHMFLTVLEDIVSKKQSKNVFFQISSNILSFAYNIFRSENVWLHQQENKKCECLRKLCKLTMGIVYKNLEMYGTPNSMERFLLKNGVTLLNLLTFNAYDLTQKYVTDFANFKEIVYRLMHIGDKMDYANLNKLEKLSTTEDLPQVPKEKFIEVNL